MPDARDKAIVLLMQEAINKIFLYTSDMKSVADFETDGESFVATIKYSASRTSLVNSCISESRIMAV